jgi:hypothetical protein
MKNAKRLSIAALPLIAAGWAVAQEKPPAPSVATPVPVAATNANADDFLSEAFNPQEHASTWANPPFSRQVLPDVAAPEETGPPIWDGWQIAAVDKFKGKFTVGLVTKKNEFRLIKEGETHDAESVTLVSVESNGIITDTVVHLSGGGRTGTLTFDQARLASGPKNAPKAPAKPIRTAPQRPVRTATPQQAAAQAQAKAQAQQELNKHLNAATAAQPTTGGAPAAGGAQPAAAAPTPTRTRRRSVVLPPSK